MLIAGVTVGTIANATLTGTTFEGNDGNTIVDGGLGSQDWVNAPNLVVQTDQATGQCDNSFTQGSKEDETNVVIGLGSIPNSKADLGKFGVAFETISGGTRDGHVMMYLAWTRNNLSGTTNFDFEINRVAQPSMLIQCPGVDRAITLNRNGDAAANGGPGGSAIDDILINYDIQGGAQNPTLGFRRWTGTSWSAATALNATNSEGRISSAPVVFDGVTYPTAAFGEAAIDMTAAGIVPNQTDPNAPCTGFGSAYVKSRASSSFTAQMKDYIAPASINLNTCGSITIDKVTVPAGSSQSFNFDGTPAAPAKQLADFSLTDAATPQSFTDLTPGQYVVSEGAVTGWDLTNLSCQSSGGANVTPDVIDLLNRTVTINLDARENVTCTFTNTAKASLHILKETDPRGQAGVFGFTADGGLASPFNLSDDGVAQDYVDIAPGTYHVDETTQPPGFAPTGALCTNGDDPTTAGGGVTLVPGDDVTCTFTNAASASIHYTKVAERDDGTLFDYSGDFNFTLTHGQTDDRNNLALSTYSVTEGDEPGWNLQSQNCDNGETAASVTLTAAGQSVTCTFVNVLERGAIDIAKTTVKGNAPLANIEFTVADKNGVVVGGGTTDEFGHVCVSGLIVLDGPFTVHEIVPPGYAQHNNDQVVPVTEGDCTSAAPVSFENIPLSDIHVQVHSQVPGATASSIDCQPTNVPPVPISDEPTLDAFDLEPGTYVCTIVIDP